MNPETGAFISMDTYQGDKFDPVSLHKYLYANANPVTYSDPSGNNVLALALGFTIDAATATVCLNILGALLAAICVVVLIALIDWTRVSYLLQSLAEDIADGSVSSADASEEVSAEITSNASSGTGASSPDPNNNKKKNKKNKKSDYKKQSPEEIERRFKLDKDEFHRNIKPKIISLARKMAATPGAAAELIKFIRQNTNPDIAINKDGFVALVSRTTGKMIELGITIWEIINGTY